MILDIFLVSAGSIGLLFSADRLVASSSGLALRWGLSPVVVGAVVIGFGSSVSELLVSLSALDQPDGLDLAMGNVIGSNIANIGLVLGFSVLLFPFAGTTKVIRREGALMLGALILLTMLLWDGVLTSAEGALLLGGLVVSGLLVTRWSKGATDQPAVDPDLTHSTRSLVLTSVVALVALAVFARLLVLGAEGIALELGLAEGLVGLTILALGTSLPELGTVLTSARRGHNDLVLGNILGSNIFNSFGVAGVVGILGSGRLTTDFHPGLVLMVVIAVFAGLAALTGDRFRRVEGAVMLMSYPFAIWLAI